MSSPRDTLWAFETARFSVSLRCELDIDPDLSWADADTMAKIDRGDWTVFVFIVSVRLDGREIAASALGGSVYADPRDFARDHRDTDPRKRNSSIMRAANGDNAVICHYFPGMVREPIADARSALANALRLAA